MNGEGAAALRADGTTHTEKNAFLGWQARRQKCLLLLVAGAGYGE